MKNWIKSLIKNYQSAREEQRERLLLKKFTHGLDDALQTGNLFRLISQVYGSYVDAPTGAYKVLSSRVPQYLREKPEIITKLGMLGCLSSMFRNVAADDIAAATRILMDKKDWHGVNFLTSMGVYPFSYNLHPRTIYKTVMTHFLQADAQTQAEMRSLVAGQVLTSGVKQKLDEKQIDAVRAQISDDLEKSSLSYSSDPVSQLNALFQLRDMLGLKDHPDVKKILSMDIIEKGFALSLDLSASGYWPALQKAAKDLHGENNLAVRFFEKGILSGDAVTDIKRLYNLRRLVGKTYHPDINAAAEQVIERFLHGDNKHVVNFVERLERETWAVSPKNDAGDLLAMFAYRNASWISVRKISQALIDAEEAKSYVEFLGVMEELGSKHLKYVPLKTVQQCAELLAQAGDVDNFASLLSTIKGHATMERQIRPSYVRDIAAQIGEFGLKEEQTEFVCNVMGHDRWRNAMMGANGNIHWVIIPSTPKTHEYDIVMRFTKAAGMEFFAGCLYKKGLESLREHWKAHADPQRRTRALPLVKDVLLSLASETPIEAPHCLWTHSRKKLAGIAMQELG